MFACVCTDPFPVGSVISAAPLEGTCELWVQPDTALPIPAVYPTVSSTHDACIELSMTLRVRGLHCGLLSVFTEAPFLCSAETASRLQFHPF